ncbi:flagellar basal body rod protein FlgB [Clostridium sp. Marseille-P299]|uniref:flagellar basal body rod protein FlgB n=1 Tax=Clostridium sp. Marseille-P299 TaxID=1805477 RepID=UPI000835E9D9|nr:flagellar basal body rod protein FlgB [Clostridium sp. Marseille-P299]
MIGTNAFNYVNVLDKAADASVLRHEVISNNIANNDTANYKRKDVRFEEYLKKELNSGDDLNKKVTSMDLSKLDATTYTDLENLSYRTDGNNVNIETENANLAENQIRYYALLDSLSQEFSRIKSVLQR